MHLLRFAPVALAISTSTVALADEPYAITPSGQTEAIFDLPVTQTSDKIANGCIDLGWTVVNTTSTLVTCQAHMSTMQSLLSALLIGNQYSTPPKQYIRFNIAGLQGGSRVQATGWIETQMAFGQTQTEEMTAAHYHNNVMDLFQGLGGRLPPGTTFPNHAYIGARFEQVDNKPGGLRVIELNDDSPLGEAGVVEGDVITRIAKERIKGHGDLLDGLRKAVKQPTYEVELTRDGKPVKLTATRAYRAEVVGPVMAALPPEPQSAAPTAIMALSPADELAKFAKLRDDGIITAAEFEVQKSKILGLE